MRHPHSIPPPADHNQPGGVHPTILRIWLAICLAACLVVAGCATSPRHAATTDAPRRLTLAELQANPALAAEVQRAFASEVPLVLVLEQGNTLPLRLEMHTPALTMAPVTAQVVIHRDMHLRISRKGLSLSPDGRTWTSVRDVDQTKALLGAHHAGLSLALGALAGEGVAVMLSLNATAGK